MAFASQPQHSLAAVAADTYFNRTKDAIYRHPLFPLLAAISKKSDLALCTPNKACAECIDDFSVQSFDKDIAVFCEQLRKEKPYYIADPELDEFMVLAIQVLRFLLLEIEKVHELCDAFCTRYIGCLRRKRSISPNSMDLLEFGNGIDSTDDSSESDISDLTYRDGKKEQKALLRGIFHLQLINHREDPEGKEQ